MKSSETIFTKYSNSYSGPQDNFSHTVEFITTSQTQHHNITNNSNIMNVNESIYTKFNIPNFQGCSFLCMLLWRGFFCTRIKLVAPTQHQLRAGMDIMPHQFFDTPPLEFGKIAIGSH